MRKLGCLVALILWLGCAALLACIPATPFWYCGYGLTGCFVWLLAGMPFGLIMSFFVLAAIFGKKDKDTPNNRVSRFLKPSNN